MPPGSDTAQPKRLRAHRETDGGAHSGADVPANRPTDRPTDVPSVRTADVGRTVRVAQRATELVPYRDTVDKSDARPFGASGSLDATPDAGPRCASHATSITDADTDPDGAAFDTRSDPRANMGTDVAANANSQHRPDPAADPAADEHAVVGGIGVPGPRRA